MEENRTVDSYRENGYPGLFGLLTEMGEDLLITILIAWLFYRSPLAMVYIFPVGYINRKRRLEAIEDKKQEAFHLQFRELLNILASSISAGYSVERAFIQGEKEMEELFGEKQVFKEDLHRLNSNVHLNMPVESAFLEFAKKWPYEEVLGFAEIFAFAKRLGGDYSVNIRKTAISIGDHLELRQEIQAITADKRMELRVMCVMPVGILLYITLASPEFLAGSYHNAAGILVMTICLGVYTLAVWLGKRIIRKGTGR